jgi:hypothetical protein
MGHLGELAAQPVAEGESPQPVNEMDALPEQGTAGSTVGQANTVDSHADEAAGGEDQEASGVS